MSDRPEEALQIILRRRSLRCIHLLRGIDGGDHLRPFRAERRGDLIELFGALAGTAIEPILNGTDAEAAIGDGVRRAHEAGQIEIVRHGEQCSLAILHDADVVERIQREIGVTDHVIEQHHVVQRRRVDVLEREPRQLDDAAAETAGDVVLVLDEDGVARCDGLAVLRVDVGRAREAGAKRLRRDEIQQRIGELLAQHILIERLVVLAMRPELQVRLSLERRAGGFLRDELEAQRHEAARPRHAPQVTARAQAHVQRPFAPARIGHRDHPRIPRGALRIPILINKLEIGRERERQRLGLLEQRAANRFGAARFEHGRLRPWLDELQQRVLLRRRRRVLRNQRCRRRAQDDGGRERPGAVQFHGSPHYKAVC